MGSKRRTLEHSKQVQDSAAHRDKMHEQLQNNYIREKLLDENFQRSGYDNKDLFKFLKLLKRNRSIETGQLNRIRIEE